MSEITRREFLEYGARLAALMGLGASAAPALAGGLSRLASGTAPLLWLQGQSCSGCSVSLLNAENPGPAQLLTKYVALLFHSTLSAATGDVSMSVVNRAVDEGDYLLVVEGSVPSTMAEACVVGEEAFTQQLMRAARRAKAVVAVGSCAAMGGIPAATGNPTGAMSVVEYLGSHRVDVPVIRLPGCPAHPDWIVGTLAHVLNFGMPGLDSLGRPTMFYGRCMHDQCARFADYERERFAARLGGDGCLFKLGCLGPITHADCALRLWNAGTNMCIRAGAPCIGCASEQFARSAEVPFLRKNEKSSAKEE